MFDPVDVSELNSREPVSADNQQRAGEKSAIELDKISYQIGDRKILDQLSLACPAEKMTVLLGTSGSGKSTLLRLVAGLIKPDQGRILANQEDVTFVRPQERPISLVFQNFSLFPHLTVAENVAYGLVKYDQSVVDVSLINLDILHLSDRYPNSLSGGQKQRVALARALANRPEILLLDEPLAHVDLPLRGQIREDIRSLQRRFGMTGLYVTHDLTEALAIADHIAVIQDGQICQFGPPEEIYYRPSCPFVAHFLGATNFLHSKITRRVANQRPPQQAADGSTKKYIYYGEVLGREYPLATDRQLLVNDQVLLVARPHTISLHPSYEQSIFGPVGQVIDRRFLGDRIEYAVETQVATLSITTPTTVPDKSLNNQHNFQIGDRVEVFFHSLWVVD